jgi:hypothetical protein
MKQVAAVRRNVEGEFGCAGASTIVRAAKSGDAYEV